jgi:hypothetical protein
MFGYTEAEIVGQPFAHLFTTEDMKAGYQKTKELGAANQYKDHFLAVLSHEPHNPLAPIRTATQVVCQQMADNPIIRPACAETNCSTRCYHVRPQRFTLKSTNAQDRKPDDSGRFLVGHV